MTEQELSEIEARAAAATPGPWRVIEGTYPWHPSRYVEISNSEQSMDQAPANAEFIAHAREDIPRLIAALREAWADIEAGGVHGWRYNDATGD